MLLTLYFCWDLGYTALILHFYRAPSSSFLLLAKTITHPAARSLCDSWASCSVLVCICLYTSPSFNESCRSLHVSSPLCCLATAKNLQNGHYPANVKASRAFIERCWWLSWHGHKTSFIYILIQSLVLKWQCSKIRLNTAVCSNSFNKQQTQTTWPT